MPDLPEAAVGASSRTGYPITQLAVRRPDAIFTVLDRLAATHPDTDDLCTGFTDPDDPEVTALLARIVSWPEQELPFRAYEIPGSQLDRLLRVFIVQTDPSLRVRIDTILQIRMKRRFCALVWQLLQDRCRDAALLSLLFAGAAGRPLFRAGTGDNLRFLELFRPEDRVSGLSLPERAYRCLLGMKAPIDGFFAAYTIHPDGDLALEVLAQYFAGCDKNGMLREAPAFARLFGVLRQTVSGEDADDRLAEILAPPLGQYLLELEPTEYDGERLRDLLPRYGIPDPSRPLWGRLDDKKRVRFSQWIHLDQLRAHLAKRPRKVRILGGLYPYIENVIADAESSLLFIYFSRFVLVDRPEEPDIMLLYPRKLFATTYERFVSQRNARLEILKMNEEDESLVVPSDKDEVQQDSITNPVLSDHDEAQLPQFASQTEAQQDSITNLAPSDRDEAQDLQAPETLAQFALPQLATQIEAQQDSMPNLVPSDKKDAQDLQAPDALAQLATQIEPQQDSITNLAPPIISWPVDPSALVMARIAILETRTERDRRHTLAQSILRGECDRIIQMRFEDTPILYARQFLYDLLG